MIIPVRCFTCNRVLGSKYMTYLKKLKENIRHTKFTELLNIINHLPDTEKVLLFEVLDEKQALKCFKLLSAKSKKAIINQLHHLKSEIGRAHV